jgi:hypothetical protein
MNISKTSLILTAAFTSLLGGTMARLSASPAPSDESILAVSSASPLAGQFAETGKADKKDGKKSGKETNSCKGKGGCGRLQDGQEVVTGFFRA